MFGGDISGDDFGAYRVEDFDLGLEDLCPPELAKPHWAGEWKGCEGRGPILRTLFHARRLVWRLPRRSRPRR